MADLKSCLKVKVQRLACSLAMARVALTEKVPRDRPVPGEGSHLLLSMYSLAELPGEAVTSSTRPGKRALPRTALAAGNSDLPRKQAGPDVIHMSFMRWLGDELVMAYSSLLNTYFADSS